VEQLVTVRGDAELVARTAHLFAGITEEFACAARDLATWNQPGARAAIGHRPRSGDRALTVRKLLSPLALVSEQARDQLREVVGKGVNVRIARTALPRETILLDRRVLVLAGPQSPRGREYTITTVELLVGGVVALFDAAWESAADFTTYLATDQPKLDPASKDILRTLGAGLTDETAARHLGLSVRTYRRRVADLMTRLDADSRFQAGARAATLGLTG
jgi:DNA-binding NarL/FixJ family response regulator